MELWKKKSLRFTTMKMKIIIDADDMKLEFNSLDIENGTDFWHMTPNEKTQVILVLQSLTEVLKMNRLQQLNLN